MDSSVCYNITKTIVFCSNRLVTCDVCLPRVRHSLVYRDGFELPMWMVITCVTSTPTWVWVYTTVVALVTQIRHLCQYEFFDQVSDGAVFLLQDIAERALHAMILGLDNVRWIAEFHTRWECCKTRADSRTEPFEIVLEVVEAVVPI